MRERHPSYFNPAPVVRVSSSSSVNRGMGSGVEKWRELTTVYFGVDRVDRALCLMVYESGGNENAYNPSGASGLMQVLSGWADDYGVAKSDLFVPEINLRIAADLQARFGWTQWSPYNRGLCH